MGSSAPQWEVWSPAPMLSEKIPNGSIIGASSLEEGKRRESRSSATEAGLWGGVMNTICRNDMVEFF
jgi:hypothetical protein